MKRRSVPAVAWTIPLAFAAFYALWPRLDLPRFYYAPETREVFWHKPENAVVMGWYGRLTMATLAGVVLGALLVPVTARLSMPWQNRGPYVAAGVTLGAMVLTAIDETVRWIL